jgi:hypothetical protein
MLGLASKPQPSPIQSNSIHVNTNLLFVPAHRSKKNSNPKNTNSTQTWLTRKLQHYSGLKPVISPLSTRCSVIALITAAPNPDPSAAVVMIMGSCLLSLGQSKISPRACAHWALKRGFLATKRSAATCPEEMFFLRQMAAIPQAARRAPRVAINCAARRQKIRSGSVRVMLRSWRKSSRAWRSLGVESSTKSTRKPVLMVNDLYNFEVSWFWNRSPRLWKSMRTWRKISPMYMPALIFSKVCSPGRGDSLSIFLSYVVRGSTHRSLSKAPYSQLMAMGKFSGRPPSLAMEPQFSMYEALQPPPNIAPMMVSGSLYADAIMAPTVSLMRATI